MLKLFKMSKLIDWAGQYRASKAAFEKGLKKEEELVARLQDLVRDRLQVIMKQSKGNTAQVVIVQLRGFVTDLKSMAQVLSRSRIQTDLESASNSIDQYLRKKNQELTIIKAALSGTWKEE